MALPAAPPISLLQIYTEFGAPVGTPLSQMLRGGQWVPNTPQNANIPTSLPISILDFIGASGEAIFMPPALNVTANAPSGPQTAELRFYSNGELWALNTANGDARVPGAWMTGGNGAEFEVIWQPQNAGSLSAGSDVENAWHNLGTTRRYVFTRPGQGFAERIGNIFIRRAATQAVVATTLNATLAIDVS